MKVLVTGSNGFVGRNLVLALKQLKNGNDKTRPNLKIDEIYEYDIDKTYDDLDVYCRDCDFVFNFAGINRPKDSADFKKGNVDFLAVLLKRLVRHNNRCPIMYASSVQASLEGRFKGSEYGMSKLLGERLLFEYNKRIVNKILVYRFPNLFGKWCRPNYNSAVATFCNNYAHDLPITVNNPNVELELLYIDDLVKEMLDALEGKEHRDGQYCYVPTTYKVKLGEIVEYLDIIKKQPENLIMPEIPDNSFIKKLYSTYLSYLPKEKTVFDLKMNKDDRGSFTELLKTEKCGQFSVNITKPGVTKGMHFHNSKWEFFIVVKGKAFVRERNLATGERYDFRVDGNNIKAIHMLPGWTHEITNLSTYEDLVTVMWANEIFDKNHPDTYFEKV